MVNATAADTASSSGRRQSGPGRTNSKSDVTQTPVNDVIGCARGVILADGGGEPGKLIATCGKETGTLLPDKFGPGGNSRCIRHHLVPDKLLNLIEFAALAGKKSSWAQAVKIDGKLFNTLLEQNVYKRCGKDCQCDNCKDARDNPTDLGSLINIFYKSPVIKQESPNARRKSIKNEKVKDLTDKALPKASPAVSKFVPSVTNVVQDEFCSSPDPGPSKGSQSKSSTPNQKVIKKSTLSASSASSITSLSSTGPKVKKRLSSAADESSPQLKRKQQDIRNFFSKQDSTDEDSEVSIVKVVKKTSPGFRRRVDPSANAKKPKEGKRPQVMKGGDSKTSSAGKSSNSAQQNGLPVSNGVAGKKEAEIYVKKPVTPVKIRFEGGELARINSTDEMKRQRGEDSESNGPLSPDKSSKTNNKNAKTSEPSASTSGSTKTATKPLSSPGRTGNKATVQVKTEPGLKEPAPVVVEPSRPGKRKWGADQGLAPVMAKVKIEPGLATANGVDKPNGTATKLPTYTIMIKQALGELNQVGGNGCTKLEILLYILRKYKPKDNIANVTNKVFKVLEVGLKKGLFLSSASCTPRKLKQAAGKGASEKPSVVRNLNKPSESKSKSTNSSSVKEKVKVKVKKEGKGSDAATPKVKKEPEAKSSDRKAAIGMIEKRLKEPLATICKSKRLSRKEALKRTWTYIRTKKLLDPKDKTRILCDERLKKMTRCKAIPTKSLLSHIKNYLEPL